MPSLADVRPQPWLWLMLVAAIGIHVLMMGSLFWGYLDPFFDNSDMNPQAIDFFSIYEAGNRILHNVSIYFGDPTVPLVTPYAVFYRYLPMFAYVFAAPANVLPPWPAYWAWVAFYELLLVANAYTTWRIADTNKWGLIGASMWFVFTPFYLEQYMGQFSFLMATGLFWTGIGIARGREAIAGPPWAVSLVVKSNSAVLLPVFLRLHWWRSVAGGIALVGLNGFYFLFYTKDVKFFYDANIQGIHSDPLTRFANYQPGEFGVVAFVRNSFMALDSTASGINAAVPIAIIAIIAGLSIAATFLPLKTDRLALFVIWLSTYFLVYGAWEHHYVMYLPVVVLLVALRPSVRPWALLVFAFVALPTPYWLLNNVWNTSALPASGSFLSIQEAWPAWGVVLHHASKPMPVLALWGYFVFQQMKSGVRIPAHSAWVVVPVTLAAIGLMVFVFVRDGSSQDPAPNDAALAINSSMFLEDESGAAIRIMLVGDSIARSLSVGLYGQQQEEGFVLRDISVDSCGVMPGEVSYGWTKLGARCDAVRERWQPYVDLLDVDVVVLQISVWDGRDRTIDGSEVEAGSPSWQKSFRAALQDAVDVFSSRGASVVLLTAPYINPTAVEPAIIDQLNDGARFVADANGSGVSLLDLDRLLNQDGEYKRDLRGIVVRSNDDVHFTLDGSEFVGGWLAPQLVEVAADSATDGEDGQPAPTGPNRLVNADAIGEGGWLGWRSELSLVDDGILVSSSDIAYSAFVRTDASNLSLAQGETYVALVWVRSDAESTGGEIEIAVREDGAREGESLQIYRLTNYWQPILVEHTTTRADLRSLELLILRLGTEAKPDAFIIRDAELRLTLD